MFRRLLDAPYVLLTLVPLFWAGNIVLGRHVAGQVPPVALAWFRWVLAFLILLPFTYKALREDWPLIRRHFGLLTLIAFTGISAYNTIFYWGLQFTPALNGLLMQSTGPLLIALWAFLLLGDRLSAGQAIGISLSLVGVVIIICRGDLAVLTTIGFNIGDIALFSAMVLYGLYSALLGRRPPLSRLGFLAFSIGWGAVLLTPAFIWERFSGPPLSFNLLTLVSMAYVAVFASVLAYLFFNRGVDLIGPNRAAPFFHLMPLFGSVLAILFLGETPHLYHAAGYALVLCGVATATFFGKKKAAPEKV
ncbi:DMT family transporter [Ancylobacter sp. A5.8]|uniref:DMT family transporter n=1 Tax=Ancylobacter gelatini TaxID=2919920 RepID=UPI001F4E703D|nr:DMT family transporter [Ancylobacter gelatini]MCJ8144798.1 DMT family transporter [Ancylobacter gelatini]